MVGTVIRAEHRFNRTHDMPIETIIWPWWYGTLLFVGLTMLGLAAWLGRDRDDD